LVVDRLSTFEAYQALHASYSRRALTLSNTLIEANIDLVIADIPYVAIEAAHIASIPVVAIASLTWDKIIGKYLDAEHDEVKKIIEEIRLSQSKATLALLPEPSMAIDSFENVKSIPPILLDGKKLIHLRNDLGISSADQRKLVMVSLGGILADNIPFKELEKDKRFHWLFDIAIDSQAEHLHSVNTLQGVRFRDLMASVDAAVGKPGYATAVEIVKYELPFVFVCRGDFPDEPSIVNWLNRHSRCMEINKDEWLSGKFGDYLESLLTMQMKAKSDCNGAQIAGKLIHGEFFAKRL